MKITVLKFQDFIKNFAFSFLLLAPFFDFLRFNDYKIIQPEALTIIIVLSVLGFICGRICNALNPAGAAILTAIIITLTFSFFPVYSSFAAVLFVFMAALLFCMLFSKHKHELLGVIFLVFGLAILLLPMQTEASHPISKNIPITHASKKLPPIVYIILDEHMGIDAVPDDTQQGRELKASLQRFYLNNGFHLFANAYSHYPNTYNSIPNLLNFTQSPIDNYYFNSKVSRHLLQNKLFDIMTKNGYQIKVYQAADYLDYCSQKNVALASCYSFPTMSIGLLQQTTLSYKQRLLFLEKSFLLQSSFYQNLMDFYQYTLQPFLQTRHLYVPNWNWDEARVSSLPMLTVFAKLCGDLQQNADGTFFFAHIFAPHSPYAFDADCHLLPPNQWKIGSVAMPFVKNTPQTRADIYKTYDGQTACVEKQMQQVFDAMHKANIYNNAIIIVQGDHGSRIAIHKPFPENKKELTQQDFKDYYLTLFAVKIPGASGQYDKRFVDIQTLLASLMINGSKVSVANDSYVYLLPPAVGMPLVKMPVKEFSTRVD